MELEQRRPPPRPAPPPPGVGLQRWRAAVHEAGHLTVAWAHGATLRGGEVYAEGGRCRYDLPNLTTSAPRIAGALGGPLAERHLAGGQWPDCISADDQRLVDFELAGSDESAGRRLRLRGEALALAAIHKYRAGLLAVAQSLAHHGQIDGRQAAAALRVAAGE
ncbi:hypothetical protein [Thiohalospira halophila]|uniref:hypothetical protein n=1 Tax=Thiohalospira halophila TaxID=381300 RepID=UPI001180889C|nr:hypothetical protein [Thiohalospira halophila]